MANLKPNRQSGNLIVCIVIAVILWFMISLNKVYIIESDIQLSYQKPSNGTLFVNELPQTGTVQISGKGWNLIREILAPKRGLRIAIEENSYQGVLDLNIKKSKINEQISSELEIKGISPSLIPYKLEKKVNKIVKIKPDIDFQYKSGYSLVEDIKVSPQFITIYGPESVLDTLNFIKTRRIVKKNLDATYKDSISLKLNQKLNLEADLSKIFLEAKIEKYTQAELKLTLQVINGEGKGIIIPEKDVHLRFILPISKYESNKMDELKSQFRIVVDLNNLDKTKSTLPLKVITKPDFIKQLKLTPSEVNYLIVTQ